MNDRMKLICVFNYDGKYIDFLFLDYFKYYSKKKINKQTKSMVIMTTFYIQNRLIATHRTRFHK